MTRRALGRTALVAVSDPNARASVVRALRASRFEVETSAEWMQTMARIEAGRFDVVIVEAEMPVVGGFDFLRAIRFNRPGTLAFLLGNGQSDDDVRRARHAGAAGYIRKPVNERAVALEVVGAFEEAHSRRLLKSLGIKGGKLRMIDGHSSAA